jgi:murein DD-endopeptidase MepM/ murein hydrolase activator NlpD
MNRIKRRTLTLFLIVGLLAVAPAAADAAGLGSRSLHVGSHGPDVVQLQSALARLGYRVAVDGGFGPRTGRAVRRFERANGFAVDGRVSPREGQAIARAAGAAPAATVAPPAVPSATSHVFPVDGPYSLGGPANRFGAPRSGHTHQGQDVLAPEGTPLVSASGGTVYWRGYQAAAAGYYVVIRGTDGFDYVYMHLREATRLAVGGSVVAGQSIGNVGHTGDAAGSHLHFELWRGHWQAGGSPVDPLPYLQSWR